jgi:SAM-dependent methyltransferase
MNRERADEIIALIERWAPSSAAQPGRRVLDFGCGTGWLSRQLAVYGQVHGVDGSPAAVDMARLENPGAHFTCADILNNEAITDLGQFDLVVSSEVIEHIPEPLKPAYAHSLEHVVRPGGTLILTTPNRLVWDYYWTPGAQGQPIEHWCTPSQLLGLLRPSFECLSLHTFHFTFTFSGIYRALNSVKLNGLVRGIGLRRPFEWFKARRFGLYIAAAFRRRLT